MTAAPDILESDLGFLSGFSPAGEVDFDSAPIYTKDWWILRHGLNFKLYPVCYSGHRALDGMLDLVNEYHFEADDVVEIAVSVTRAQLVNLFSHEPKSVSQGKFSIEFMMAMAIITRRATFAELSENFLRRSDVEALMRKVRISPFPTDDSEADSLSSSEDRVLVTLKDGRRLQRQLDHPRGHAARPLAAEVLWTKFLDCVSGAMSEAQARALFDRLQTFDRLESLAQLPFAGDPEDATTTGRQ